MTLLLISGLLVSPWAFCSLLAALNPRLRFHLPTCGVLGVSLVFLFTGLGHFIKTDEMLMMLPEWIRSRKLVVLSGLLEIAFALALLPLRYRRRTGSAVIAFLMLVFPVNVHAAATGQGLGGPDIGLSYLLLRTPVQLLLIAWTYIFAVRVPHQDPVTTDLNQDEFSRKLRPSQTES
jgi:uncharacterized membrane protein